MMTKQKKPLVQTMDYIRVARKSRDGHDGFLYIHGFGKGYQYLVFPSHAAAKRFIDNANKQKTKQ